MSLRSRILRALMAAIVATILLLPTGAGAADPQSNVAERAVQLQPGKQLSGALPGAPATGSALSNGTLALLTNMAKRAGLPWDCVLSADLFGRYKPDPATYLGAARLLGLAPTELMMVAAHAGDLRAAREHGLRSAFVARPDEWGPGGRPDRPPDGVDVAVGSFVELAERLGT